MRTKTFPDDCYVAISFAGEAYDCFNSIIASMAGGWCAEVDGKCVRIDGAEINDAGFMELTLAPCTDDGGRIEGAEPIQKVAGGADGAGMTTIHIH